MQRGYNFRLRAAAVVCLAPFGIVIKLLGLQWNVFTEPLTADGIAVRRHCLAWDYVSCVNFGCEHLIGTIFFTASGI